MVSHLITKDPDRVPASQGLLALVLGEAETGYGQSSMGL